MNGEAIFFFLILQREREEKEPSFPAERHGVL